MKIPKCNEGTILCECGHSLKDHATGCGECYRSTRRTERRKNHLGKYENVKCVYVCFCKKFEQRKPKENSK